MAEAEVTIQYRELPVTVSYRALIVLIPVLVIFLIWSSIVLLQDFINSPIVSLVIAAEVLIVASLALLTILCSDQTIFITRDGISFPFLLCPSFAARTQRSWQNLRTVQFIRRAGCAVLKLVFDKGPEVKLNLERMSPDEVDDLIVAIDVWGGGDAFPALLEARSYASGEDSLTSDMQPRSHTEIWEDELARRFGATNFIPLEPGDQIKGGSLIVLRQIAFGGMSAIYLVQNQDKQNFVLKESVVPDDGNDELKKQARELLDREAKMLAELSHRQIAAIIDHFVEGSRNYLLMEHLEGQDLRRLVKEFGAQDEQDVIYWSEQIASIVSYLHERPVPVIHRDLTPDNIILKESGELALIDFGAANLFIGTATGTIIGKQAYIAPEQLRGKASPRSDIYSFGGTMFYLLTGRDPEPLAMSHPKDFNPVISPAIDELVAQCTAMESGDRPGSMKEIARRLAGLSKMNRVSTL